MFKRCVDRSFHNYSFSLSIVKLIKAVDCISLQSFRCHGNFFFFRMSHSLSPLLVLSSGVPFRIAKIERM